MKKRYARLRGLLQAYGYDRPATAELLGISEGCLSRKMNAVAQWKSDEMYRIMDAIHQPYEKLHEIFPMNGVDAYRETEDELQKRRMENILGIRISDEQADKLERAIKMARQ